MNDTQLTTLTQVNDFLIGTHVVSFCSVSRIVSYLLKVTGYSRQQLTRLIKQHRSLGKCGQRRKLRHSFPAYYKREDILLLAKMENGIKR